MEIVVLFIIVIIVIACVVVVYNLKSEAYCHSKDDEKTEPRKPYNSIEELPEGIKQIDRFSFYKGHIKSAIVPNTVTDIWSDAFRECENLVSVYIPDSVARIDIRAFYSCTSLQSIHIGSGIRRIESRAFAACRNVTEFHIKSPVPPIVRGHYVLPFHKMNNPDECTLYVPKGSLDMYRNKDGWKDFLNIVEE